ncbi:hypothetical protein TTHERM_000283279 (macronuclear) [Tetrahymena thermophila SB210]|uniref:Uncharacterized protein n=1 Tax=Tetrahymena thermophila (strain SB210) TaxID=312017 RepID=W7X943_TETTS|nr:hypothetical protein TTHERM_000283279 [Tetrahymena thermophila SB210]EWS73867.1 hypothetical protein TTHERM_000283279 [Tetrahymena thermophila SB210]|eukprot:XP_012653614.1 hypothetical protein TTHERM_000283279 [Tetrahymena thermophila SB210]
MVIFMIINKACKMNKYLIISINLHRKKRTFLLQIINKYYQIKIYHQICLEIKVQKHAKTFYKKILFSRDQKIKIVIILMKQLSKRRNHMIVLYQILIISNKTMMKVNNYLKVREIIKFKNSNQQNRTKSKFKSKLNTLN